MSPAAAALTLAGLVPAFANGMGDPSTVLKEKNAICEAQRRGQGPMYPNMCLPELPPDTVPAQPHRDWR